MKALNPFGYTEVATLSEKDSENPQWICDSWTSEWVFKDDLDDYLKTIEDHVEKDPKTFLNIEVKKIRNKDFMDEYVYGCPTDDDLSAYTKEECPECGHLLAEADKYDKIGKFCTNHECSFLDDKYTKYLKEEEEERRKLRENPSPEFREVGLSLEGFCEKYGVHLKGREMETCTVCKQKIKPVDWYLMGGYAVVSYKHDNCNNGPCVMVPYSKKEKEAWGNLLGGNPEPPEGA